MSGDRWGCTRVGDASPPWFALIASTTPMRTDSAARFRRGSFRVLDLEPDLSQIPTAMMGAIGACPSASEHAFELRTFAPGIGVTEDPVCGSMSASVGQWLTSTG